MNSQQTIEHLSQYFCQPLHIAAALNKLSISDFKRIYQAHGIQRWPYNKFRNQKTSTMSGFQNFQINAPAPIVKQKKTILKKTTVAPQKPVEFFFDEEFENFCKDLNNDSEISLFESYLIEEPLFLL
jgi:hypothetical protein